MKRVLAAARPHAAASALALLAVSCTPAPVILPSQDFNRPMDIAFVCMSEIPAASASDDAGAPVSDAGDSTGAEVLTGRPMRECHPRGIVDVPSATHHTFAFLPSSASGELSVIDADTWNLVNLAPANPGFSPLPLGLLPSQISASDDGCRLVTANHGSCDLSFVDPAALLAPTVAKSAQKPVKSSSETLVTNVVPLTKNGRKPLRVLAGEVSFIPMDTSGIDNACSGDPSHTWQALATFPSCDLVALIDLPTGVIQKAAYAKKTADGTGVELVPIPDGQDPSCPVDCSYTPTPAGGASEPDGAAPEVGTPEAGASDAGVSDAGASEAGASDAGAVAEAGAPDASAPETGSGPVDPGDVPYVGPGALRPGPIAIEPQSGRAYVGLGNAAFVLAFNLGETTLSGAAIALHEGAIGVDRLRLSIDPYQDLTAGGGKMGTFVGDDPAISAAGPAAAGRRYLYAIARDGSLRVIQAVLGSENECETNTDFASIPVTPPDAPNNPRTQAMIDATCPPVVGPAGRRPNAIGPGIRFATPPVDIAAVDIRPDPPDNSETSVSGAHAWVLTASGAVYLVNIDPVLRHVFWVTSFDPNTAKEPAVLECATPQVADCFEEPAPAPNTVRNRSFVGYTPALDPSTGPARLDVPPAQSSLGPRISSFWTRGTPANATVVTSDWYTTYVYFPDQSAVTQQSWSLTWEGDLLSSPRFTGQIVTGNALSDVGIDFCRLGVKDADVVTVEGCTNTSQCGIGKNCVLGSNGAVGAGGLPITGLCLTPTVPVDQCADLLSTVKRYDVTLAQQHQLAIEPHKDEIVRPAIKPCVVFSASGAPEGADGGADASSDAGVDASDASSGDAKAARLKDDCPDPNDSSTDGFKCVDFANQKRCLYPCEVPNSTAGCRAGRICVAFGKTDCSDGQCYCADAPPLGGQKAMVSECLGELFSYQVGVGRGFAVTGSQTALPATGQTDPTTMNCEPIPNLDPRTQIRVSLDEAACTAPVLPFSPSAIDTRCDPNTTDPSCVTLDSAASAAMSPFTGSSPTEIAQNMAQAGQTLLEQSNLPNPCLLTAGPNESDAPNLAPPHVAAMFRNRELQFMLTNLDRGPSGVFQIRFDVHGGFQPQTVTIPSTVEVTMPARLVVGPFDANNPTTPTAPIATHEVPYLFVVDQRRLGRAQGGGPTRGQLLRIHPRGFAVSVPVAGAQPWYEDLSHSNNLFPIQ